MAHVTRILVPTHFCPASDAALTYARSLAHQLGASIHLVHVFEDPFTSGAFVGDGTVALPLDLRQSLERLAREQLAARHTEHVEVLRLSPADVLKGSTARRIVEHAKAIGADLIVMGTRGRGGLGHLLRGIIAEKVVRTARCPVLTVREPHPEAAAA